MSPSFPFPSVIFVRRSRRTVLPILQGGHFPHDSSVVNSRKNFDTLTMQLRSFITTIPPEPTIAPVFMMSSKVTGVSSRSSGIQPPEGPPSWTALNFLPLGTPPPMSKMIFLNGIPIGTSMRPILLIAPLSAKTFVPDDFSVPRLRYQSAPFRMIWGMFAKVSTLFRTVGLSQSPLTADRQNLGLGIPRFPSMERISAVASPQTKAP